MAPCTHAELLSILERDAIRHFGFEAVQNRFIDDDVELRLSEQFL